MRKYNVAVFTVLMASVVSLPAQDSSAGRRGIPDADTYSDLLTGGKKPGSRAVRVPDGKDFKDLLGAEKKPAPSRLRLPELKVPVKAPRVKAQVSDLEIDRVIAEASMHLAQVAEKSAVCMEEAGAVFEEALALALRRLEEMEKERRKEEAKKKSTAPEKVQAAEGKSSGKPQSTSVGTEPVSSKEKPGEAPASKGGASERKASLGFWAERLSKLAAEMAKAASAGNSTGN